LAVFCHYYFNILSVIWQDSVSYSFGKRHRAMAVVVLLWLTCRIGVVQ